MGIGAIAIQTSQKKEPSGPPFVPTSAHNGASIDAGGKVVLGNDVGDPSAPAQLINDREINTEDALFNLFALILNSAATGIITRLTGQTIEMIGSAQTSPLISMVTTGSLTQQQITMDNSAGGDNAVVLTTSGAAGNNLISMVGTQGNANFLASTAGGGIAQMRVNSGGQSLEIFTNGTGHINFQINQIITVIRINTATFNTQIASTQVADNGATLQVSGTLTNRLVVQGQGAGAYNVDRDLDSGKLFTNSGAATFNLPNMAAANLRLGFILRITIDNVAGSTVQASAGQTIRFAGSASSVGGTISSTQVGDYLELILINSSTWVTASFTGTWVLT